MAQETAATANWQGFSQISAHRYLLDIASQATQIKGETIESEKPGMLWARAFRLYRC